MSRRYEDAAVKAADAIDEIGDWHDAAGNPRRGWVFKGIAEGFRARSYRTMAIADARYEEKRIAAGEFDADFSSGYFFTVTQ